VGIEGLSFFLGHSSGLRAGERPWKGKKGTKRNEIGLRLLIQDIKTEFRRKDTNTATTVRPKTKYTATIVNSLSGCVGETSNPIYEFNDSTRFSQRRSGNST
jgi:hypothetical protein